VATGGGVVVTASSALRLQSKLLDAAGESIVATDVRGVVIYANEAAETLFGWGPGEMLGRNALVWMLATFSQEAIDEVVDDLRAGRRWTGEFSHRRRDGSSFLGRVTDTPVFDDHGVLIAIIAITTDITEMRQAEARLRSSECWHRSLIQHSSDMVLVLSGDGCITYASPSTHRILGYQVSDLIGTSVADLMPPGARARSADFFEGLAAGAPPNAAVLQTRHAAGGYRWIRAVANNLSNDPVVHGTVVNASDVTSEKESADALAHSESVLRRAERIARVGHWELEGAGGRLSFLGDEMFSIYGVAPGSWDGTLESFIGFAPPDDRACLSAAILGCRDHGSAEMEHEIVRADGSARFVRMRAESVLPADAGPVRVVGTCLDITDHVGTLKALTREAEERSILEARLHQAHRLEGLGRLAGGVAHDFNNLLAVIQNYTSLINEEITAAAGTTPGGERWDRMAADLTQVTRAVERAGDLTSQLLTFGRRGTVRERPVELNALLAEVEPMLRRTMGTPVDVEIRTDPDLWPIVADPGQIERVVMNVAINARDAMHDGGLLAIDTLNVEVDPESGSVGSELPPGRYARLRLSDTGCGMDPSVMGKAFEPFFTTKASGAGTGLGLATVHGIVSHAGGTCRILTQEGIGTTFLAYFPALPRPGSTSEAIEQPARAAGGGGPVLPDEDDDARSPTHRILVGGGRDRSRVPDAGRPAVRTSR
jgi:two-component system, cell cycle sensor histidine kinase and response regulator CckA